MKKLFEKIFKKETDLNYILPEYQPAKVDLINSHVANTDYYLAEDAQARDADEMQIDNLYRSA